MSHRAAREPKPPSDDRHLCCSGTARVHQSRADQGEDQNKDMVTSLLADTLMRRAHARRERPRGPGSSDSRHDYQLVMRDDLVGIVERPFRLQLKAARRPAQSAAQGYLRHSRAGRSGSPTLVFRNARSSASRRSRRCLLASARQQWSRAVPRSLGMSRRYRSAAVVHMPGTRAVATNTNRWISRG